MRMECSVMSHVLRSNCVDSSKQPQTSRGVYNTWKMGTVIVISIIIVKWGRMMTRWTAVEHWFVLTKKKKKPRSCGVCRETVYTDTVHSRSFHKSNANMTVIKPWDFNFLIAWDQRTIREMFNKLNYLLTLLWINAFLDLTWKCISCER